ncbi:MAG: DsbA family protein [Candidatus Polarisedimenticolia bacterium]
MRRSRSLFFSITALTLLLACSSSGARESAPAAAAGAKQYREGLAGVDFTGLSNTQKEAALDILNANNCDCGCGMTIAQCRVEDKTCGRSPQLAKTVVDSVKAGKDAATVAAALKGMQAAAAPQQPAAPATPTKPVTISMDNAQVQGNAKAKATLVEFADYQCPYCVRAVDVVKQLQAKYPNDLKYVYKQFPLTSIHKFAEPASRAGLAAARQGKFWQMHEKLFQNSRALDDASLKKYAGELGLDAAKFANDFADPAIAKMVQADLTEGGSLGVGGTPTFFVNGVQVPSWDVNTLSKMIDMAISGGDVAAAAAEARGVIEQQQAAQRDAQRKQQEEMAKRVVDIDVKGAPMKGDPKAPVTIVEFADYQCPYCASAQPLIKQVMEAYPGKVRFVYKHFPLVSIHPNARPAAMAAVEAMQQGKFWEMHDLLYQNYSKLDRASLTTIAQQAGLDMAKFEKSMQSESHGPAVDKDMADSQSAGVNSTPTFFINGKRVMNRSYDVFKKMIDEALAAKGAA